MTISKRDGIGVLITDHNVHATLEITDRAYIISDGEIKTRGTANELAADPIARKFYLGESTAGSIQAAAKRRAAKRAKPEEDDEHEAAG